MDIYIWSMLCHYCFHPIFPQLQNLVFSWPWDDNLHRLVHGHCSFNPWPGIYIHTHTRTIDSLGIWVCGFVKNGQETSYRVGYGHRARLPKLRKKLYNFFTYIYIYILLKVDGVQHSGPKKLVLYFTGATNILYTFGGHAVTV